jgi:hypothetical protein
MSCAFTLAGISRRRRGPVAQWSELAAHNRLVGGSSPPGPTTHSYRLLVSYNTRNSSYDFNELAEIGAVGLCLCLQQCGHFSRLSLRLKFRFPVALSQWRGDWFECREASTQLMTSSVSLVPLRLSPRPVRHDCVVGTQFESSRPHQTFLSFKINRLSQGSFAIL